MTRRSLVTRHGQFQGQILLERALFCVGCEIIFTGIPRCPRCASGETVWPLSEWVRSVRPSATPAPPSNLLSMNLYQHASSTSDQRHDR
ncbi:MAG: hypothetical protein ACRERE_21285 [Candidatus Entotheonellia bacterium]